MLVLKFELVTYPPAIKYENMESDVEKFRLQFRKEQQENAEKKKKESTVIDTTNK